MCSQVSLNVDGQTNVTVTGLHATSTLTVPESVSSLFSSPYYLWVEYNPTTQTWEEVTAFSEVNEPTRNTSFTHHIHLRPNNLKCMLQVIDNQLWMDLI